MSDCVQGTRQGGRCPRPVRVSTPGSVCETLLHTATPSASALQVRLLINLTRYYIMFRNVPPVYIYIMFRNLMPYMYLFNYVLNPNVLFYLSNYAFYLSINVQRPEASSYLHYLPNYGCWVALRACIPGFRPSSEGGLRPPF